MTVPAASSGSRIGFAFLRLIAWWIRELFSILLAALILGGGVWGAAWVTLTTPGNSSGSDDGTGPSAFWVSLTHGIGAILGALFALGFVGYALSELPARWRAFRSKPRSEL